MWSFVVVLGLGVGFFGLLRFQSSDAGLEADIFDFVLDEGVEQGGIACWVGTCHHEEATAEAGGVDGTASDLEVGDIVGEMGVTVAFENGPFVFGGAKAIEEAKLITGCDGFVEFADKQG